MLNLLLCFEVILGLRHWLHDDADDWLVSHALYASRGNWQGDLLVLALMVVLIAGAFVAIAFRRAKSGIPMSAWIGTVAIIACFVVETISLHGMDAIIYLPIGPVLAIAYWWIAASAIVTISAICYELPQRYQSVTG